MYLTLEEFKNNNKGLITEWAEAPSNNSISPSDPNLSNNYWTTYRKNYVNKLSLLQGTVMANYINAAKNKVTHIIPSDLTILKIIKSANNTVDIHLSFKYDEDELWCVLKNYNTPQERLNCPDLEGDKSENVELLKRRLKNTISKWLSIAPGAYKQLKNEVVWYSDNGNLLKTKENNIITVLRSDKDVVLAEDSKGVKLRLTTPDSYYFNYWFEINNSK